MTGRCVCKQGIEGMKCDICPVGTVLGPDGCMDESIAQPVSGSCDDLFCFHGAVCREKEGDMAQCVCEPSCSEDDHKSESVCASDANTYSSECQMKLFACRYQKQMIVVHYGPCDPGPSKKPEKEKSGRKSLPTYDNVDKLASEERRVSRHIFDGTSSVRRPKKRQGQDRRAGEPIHPPFVPMPHVTPFGRVTVDISFVTYKRNGVLFFGGGEAGKSDVYLLLMIRNKYLELRIHGVRESLVIRPPRPIELGRRHQVSFRRFPRFASVHFDKKWVAMKSCSEKYSMTTFPDSFVLGAMPYSLQKSFRREPELFEFVGCIFQLRIGNHEVNVSDLLSKYRFKISQDVPRIFHHSLSSNSSRYGDVLSNRLCFQSKRNHRIRLLHTMDFEDIARADVPEGIELRLSFRTRERFVRLARWERASPVLPSSVQLLVTRGMLEVSLTCDNRRNITIRSQTRVDNNRLHSLELKRKQKKMEVYVDNAMETVLPLKSCASLFSDGEVYLLGGNRTVDGRPAGGDAGAFRGCIGELRIGSRKLDLEKFLSRHFVCQPS